MDTNKNDVTANTYANTITVLEAARNKCFSDEDGSTAMELEYLWLAARRIDAITRATVAAARMDGTTWEEIGTRLGMSKQAAQQKYGTKTTPRVRYDSTLPISELDAFEV